MVDATRKLKIPNFYQTYLEKNHIYELFHELIVELLIQKPEDHILFLKEMLYNASKSRYSPRVILLVPPALNKYELAEAIRLRCRAVVLTENIILNSLSREFSEIKHSAEKFSKCLSSLLRNANVYFNGWILPDYPRTHQEAKHMQMAGILPTHVFYLIPGYSEDVYKKHSENDSEEWRNYRCNLLEIVNTFKDHVKEIYVQDKKMEQIIQEITKCINVRKRYKAPIVPRVCLLGPKGSGRKTQALMIAERFNCVFIDFEQLFRQFWRSDTYISKDLRKCALYAGKNSLLLSAMIHKRILERDCIDRGWVLTGFPNTLEDFKYLDMMDTPPNRVIFLESDFNTCRERILRHKVNICTGSIVSISEKNNKEVDPELKLFQADQEDNIDAHHEYYCKHYEDLRSYAAGTSYLIDANKDSTSVFHAIGDILMQPLQTAITRPCTYMQQFKVQKPAVCDDMVCGCGQRSLHGECD